MYSNRHELVGAADAINKKKRIQSPIDFVQTTRTGFKFEKKIARKQVVEQASYYTSLFGPIQPSRDKPVLETIVERLSKKERSFESMHGSVEFRLPLRLVLLRRQQFRLSIVKTPAYVGGEPMAQGTVHGPKSYTTAYCYGNTIRFTIHFTFRVVPTFLPPCSRTQIPTAAPCGFNLRYCCWHQ